jgi:hypothetical protein
MAGLPPPRCRRPPCTPCVDVDRVLRPPTREVVSLRKHLSPTGCPPPVAACGVTEPDGMGPPLVGCVPASTDAAAANASPASRAESWKSSIIACCCSCIRCVGCGHGWGSCQLCTTDLVGGAAQQVIQLKLHRWCVATVVVIQSRWLKHWMLLNRWLKHWLLLNR